jgi:Thiol-activated cytolysin
MNTNRTSHTVHPSHTPSSQTQEVQMNTTNAQPVRAASLKLALVTPMIAAFLMACGTTTPSTIDPSTQSIPGAPSSGTNTGPSDSAQVKTALQTLPEWTKFAPPANEYEGRQFDKAPLWKPISSPIFKPSEVKNPNIVTPVLSPIKLPILKPGLTYTYKPTTKTDEVAGSILYNCKTTPYSITKNPSEIVTLQPDADALYPGGLIQGGSYKLGSLQPLVIDERTPIEVSVDLLSSGVREVVQEPTVGNVREAIGKLVQRAKTNGIPVGGAAMGTFFEASSSKAFALKADLSARYLTAKLDASFSYSSDASERVVNATIIQKAFTMTVQPPESIDSWFKPSFTKAKYDALVAKGAIGPDSPPVYVSSVTYGRMLFLNIKVRTDGQRIKGSLKGSYNGGVFSVKASVEGESTERSMQTEIRVVGIGASGKLIQSGIITDGNLGNYLKDPVSLDEFAPISYAMRDLRTKLPATVADTSDYDVKTCEPQLPNKVGERWMVAVDGLLLDDPGDGGNGNIVGDLFIDGKRFWNASEHTLNRDTLVGSSRTVNITGVGQKTGNGEFDPNNHYVVRDFLDSDGGVVTINGSAKDIDGGFRGDDDGIMDFNGDRTLSLAYPLQAGRFAPASYPAGPGDPGHSRLAYRTVKLCDIVYDPATKTNRPANNQCLDAVSELNKP